MALSVTGLSNYKPMKTDFFIHAFAALETVGSRLLTGPKQNCFGKVDLFLCSLSKKGCCLVWLARWCGFDYTDTVPCFTKMTESGNGLYFCLWRGSFHHPNWIISNDLEVYFSCSPSVVISKGFAETTTLYSEIDYLLLNSDHQPKLHLISHIIRCSSSCFFKIENLIKTKIKLNINRFLTLNFSKWCF